MSKEMKERLRKAGEYQRQAIRALFPEEMNGHLDAIEKELKELFMELAMELLMESMPQKTESSAKPETEEKTKKVEIV